MSELPPAGDAGDWPLSVDLAPYAALLFDLDGTLVDTMPLHGLAYAAVFERLGHRFTMDDYIAHVGPPARVAIPLFAAAAGMGAIDDAMIAAIHREKKARFKEVLARESAPTLRAAHLLARYAGRKPMALVTSSNRDGAEAILAALGWLEYFDVVISGDDVTRGKPDPEPYLTAAARLGAVPAGCVVFEDIADGVAAARAAGMTVIDVTRPGAILRAGSR